MTNPRPAFPEAAPPRATTPDDDTDARGYERGLAEKRAPFASSPTRESGALPDFTAMVRRVANSRTGFRESPAAAALLVAIATLERDAARMRENERELRFAGGQLANCAFNLAQNRVLDERARESLDACRKLWDATVEKHVAALSPSGDTVTTP